MPWSTANEDLVELFETTGQVELAEILYDGTRSKGCGVVQFAQVPEAETAIGTCWRLLNVSAEEFLIIYVSHTAKFQQYMYGGRPLGELTICAINACYADCLAQMCGSTTAGTRSLPALRRAARPSLCKPTLLCKFPWQCFLVLRRARLSSLGVHISLCICIVQNGH